MTEKANVPRIDAHQHFWRYNPEGYAWITPELGLLRHDFLPDDLRPLLEKHDLNGSIAVQARSGSRETEFLLDLADRHPCILGVVGWADLCADDLADALERYGDHPRLKGYRHQIQDEPCPADFMALPAFNRGLIGLQLRGLVYEVLIHAKDLAPAAALCARHDRAPLVLDHLGKPAVGQESVTDWGKRLRLPAELPHVFCKLSGLITEADWKAWKADDLRPYILTALELFGPERLMFGSDWPVCLLAGSYDQICDLVQNSLAELLSPSELSLVMGGNAYRVYHLA